MTYYLHAFVIIVFCQIRSNGEDLKPFNRTENLGNFEEVIPPSSKVKNTITEEKLTIGDEKMRKDYMEDVEEDEYKEIPEDQWMTEALLDVAYYLRAHKFQDFDRRYLREEEVTDEDRNLYARFPDPPLRQYHWEVFKYCSLSLTSCLKYLHSIVMDAYLQRTSDTSVLINLQGWTWLDYKDTILAVDSECKRLQNLDWKMAQPFQGPLERFQWRTSASYFMCWYTLQNESALSSFGEPCDNFANCLDDEWKDRNKDWRANDEKAFACAYYSFCPDVCCPRRHVKYRTECSLSQLSPCWNMEELTTRACNMSFQRNTDLPSIIYNRWNVTCHCREPGFVWDSRFGMCVDQNECNEGNHSCDERSHLCFNTVGGHECCCRWGYEYDSRSGNCTPSAALESIMERVKQPPNLSQVQAPPARAEAASVLQILRTILGFLQFLFV